MKIRAKDDASKAATKISDSLKQIAEDAERAAKGFAGLNAGPKSKASQLASDIAKLEAEASKPRVFNEVAGLINKSQASIGEFILDVPNATLRVRTH